MSTKTVEEQIVLSRIARGLDFVLTKALKFNNENNLCEFSPSQLNGLRNEVDKADSFATLNEKVMAWISRETKSGEEWAKIKEPFRKEMFEWHNHATELTKTCTKSFYENDPLVKKIEMLLDPNNLKTDLDEIKYKLACNFFYTLLTICRCYEQDDLKEKLEEILK